MQPGRYGKLARQEPARSGSVDHEVDAQGFEHVGRDLDPIAILDARCDRGAHEVVVHVGPEPVIVGDLIVGTRGDEQTFRAQSGIGERASGVVAVEREAAFQPAAELGETGDPAAVRGEIVAIVQSIATGEPLEREVRQRRARLADREARMGPALEQDDIMPLDGEDAREQRAGEAAADDGYAHAGQCTAGSRRPQRFMRLIRATRSGRELSQAARRSISQTSAVTAVAASARHCASAVSSCARVGGTASPSACSRSSSPLPPRTGMMAILLAPRVAAYSTVRIVHSIDSAAGTYGAPSSTNARRSMS